MTNEERRSETVVRDIPAELWIKVIAFFAACTLLVAGVAIALGGYIGTRIVDKLDVLTNTVVEAAGVIQVHDGRISSTEDDVIEIKAVNKEQDVKVEGISIRVFKLEGLK